MAAVNLLTTRTITFLELMGNGRSYTVPAYQRDYSWGEEQWEDLWNDLLELRENEGRVHYLGALVVEARSDREFTVIDGQQRLATLSLFSLAVIDRLEALARQGTDPEDNRERAQALRHRFVGEKDPVSLVEGSKLRLNETDNGLYQDYLVQLRPPLNPKGLAGSNRLLWNCFCWFRSRLEAGGPDHWSATALAQLLSETAARRLVFMLVTVSDTLSAFQVFETLNARELALSSTDLLKN
ncbi:MAG: DUF262 domain-containing protein, partial [Armatimonadetes bacterium]|nr:DUF262 domain-containing protein [Armatimonadota bacterium]